MAVTALVVEDGSTVAGANSYIDVAYADQYCEDVGYTAWADLASDAKTQAIHRSMQFIESQNYIGVRYAWDQPLAWPRRADAHTLLKGWYGSLFVDGEYIETNEIPSDLKKAVAEAAYIESQTPRTLLPTLEHDNALLRSRKRVGKIETETWWQEGATGRTMFYTLEHLLAGLVNSSGGVKLVRK